MIKTNKFFSLLASLIMLATLSSCDTAPDWGADGPYGPYTDPYLTGPWILVQYNSDNVPVQNANWFYFNGRNGGYYYFYDAAGRRNTEEIRYWNDYDPNSNRNYIQIQYASGSMMEGPYWYTHNGDTLWIQWTDQRGNIQTYVYDRVQTTPW